MTSRLLKTGDFVPQRRLTSVTGEPIQIPDPARLVHLQFRRFAGCPVCNLHLRSIVQQRDEIEAANVREVIVFHSTAGDLLPHAQSFPLDLVADPSRELYREFAVEPARRALLDPRVWPWIVRGVLRTLRAVLMRREPMPPISPPGGRFGLPADFLIASDGRIVARKYGQHAYDQWSTADIVDAARDASRLQPAAPLRPPSLRPPARELPRALP